MALSVICGFRTAKRKKIDTFQSQSLESQDIFLKSPLWPARRLPLYIRFGLPRPRSDGVLNITLVFAYRLGNGYRCVAYPLSRRLARARASGSLFLRLRGGEKKVRRARASSVKAYPRRPYYGYGSINNRHFKIMITKLKIVITKKCAVLKCLKCHTHLGRARGTDECRVRIASIELGLGLGLGH